MRWVLLFFLLCECHFASLCGACKFVVITPEKTGTHLLTKALTLMTGMDVENHWDREYDIKVFRGFLKQCNNNHTYTERDSTFGFWQRESSRD